MKNNTQGNRLLTYAPDTQHILSIYIQLSLLLLPTYIGLIIFSSTAAHRISLEIISLTNSDFYIYISISQTDPSPEIWLRTIHFIAFITYIYYITLYLYLYIYACVFTMMPETPNPEEPLFAPLYFTCLGDVMFLFYRMIFCSLPPPLFFHTKRQFARKHTHERNQNPQPLQMIEQKKKQIQRNEQWTKRKKKICSGLAADTRPACTGRVHGRFRRRRGAAAV